jgi:hypothetical protein
MLLKLRRSQRQGGMLGGKVLFALDARVELSSSERDLVNKYSLGNLSVYDSEARRKQTQAAIEGYDAAAYTGGSLSRQLMGAAKGMARSAMAALTLRVTINSLVSGQHIECKDLDELLGAEEAIRQACENLKAYITTALTFDGREEVHEF